jgi:hypothetical protein
MTPEPEEFESGLNIKRGLKMTAIFTLLGIFVGIVGQFYITGGTYKTLAELNKYAFTLAGLRRWVTVGWTSPRPMQIAFCIITLFACTGWATYAPNGKYRVGWTLALIFLLFIPMWFFGIGIRMKFHFTDDSLPLGGILVNMIPLIIISFLLSLVRANKREPEQKNPEQSGS